ncbi:hypothetical protein MTO96_041497 [Rhipicephalus appendiculatus]
MPFTKEDELNDTQVSELRDVFFKFDAERTGTVAFEHVDEILRTAGRVITDPEFKKRVKSTVPAELEKKVQFPEFVDMVQKCTRPFNAQKDLHDAFRVFDRDGHGFITTAELRHVVTTLGERMTEDEAEELIREADANNEGHVDYEEFIKTISIPVPPEQYGKPPKKRPPPPPPKHRNSADGPQRPGDASCLRSQRQVRREVGRQVRREVRRQVGREVQVTLPSTAATTSPDRVRESHPPRDPLPARAKGPPRLPERDPRADPRRRPKKSSRKSSTVAESSTMVVAAHHSGPPVEAVLHNAPAVKDHIHPAKKNDSLVPKKTDSHVARQNDSLVAKKDDSHVAKRNDGHVAKKDDGKVDKKKDDKVVKK